MISFEDRNVQNSVNPYFRNGSAVRPYADRTGPVRDPYAPQEWSIDGCGLENAPAVDSARSGCPDDHPDTLRDDTTIIDRILLQR